MGFLDRLRGKSAGKRPKEVAARSAGGSQAHPSTQGGANSPQLVRKELVRVAVRDTLRRNGIPEDWIRVEPLTMAAPGRGPGVHIRLCVQHWDRRLMLHAVSLQDNLAKRICALDPLYERWLMGVSWQLELRHRPEFPPLRLPGSWTAQPPASAALAEAATGEATDAQVDHGAGADVISGPTRIGETGDQTRRDLERLLGERDADFQGSDEGGFQATQPVKF